MSYVGYLPSIKGFLNHFPADYSPSVLEVGVDRGTTLAPIVAFLARTRKDFLVVGVDVLVQEATALLLNNLDLMPTQQCSLLQANSLEVLPKMVEQGLKFDVLLLDGDHNYHTVSQELQYLEALTRPRALVVCDDYNGRWSERDLYYSERSDYENVKIATTRVETEKHGVKPAVDEWLSAHPGWKSAQPIQGEPVLLRRKCLEDDQLKQ